MFSRRSWNVCDTRYHDNAGNLSVQTAINTLNHSNRCIVVGTDTDLLVLYHQEVYYYMSGTRSMRLVTSKMFNKA